MNQQYYGKIDLTKLGQIARQHSELVEEVEFKDGTHKLLKVSVFQKDVADKFGNTACIKANCKRDEEKQGLNYFVADLKNSTPRNETHKSENNEPHRSNVHNDDLPY